MNFAIVGCGFIAKKHAEAISNLDNANLVAVCDKRVDAMLPFKEVYNVSMFSNIEEMLLKKEIDVVCVCTPSGLHAQIAILAAKYKKHVIVEKPIAMSLEDAKLITDTCNDNNVKITVMHPNRFRPVVSELRSILDQGLLGKISHANCLVNWNRNQEYYDQASWRGTKEHDGGVLMNQAIHNIDLLLWFMGKPKRVFSMEATRLRKIEAEDVSTGLIKFESGALGIVQASTTAYGKNFEESISIFGEKGTVKIGGPNALYFEELQIEGWSTEKINQLKEKINKDPYGLPGHQLIIEDFMNAIRQNNEPYITGEDGIQSLELVLSFYESAKENKPINLG